MTAKTIQILIVEDSAGDARLIAEVLKHLNVKLELQIVKDGQEAIDFLYKNGRYSEVQTPDMIFLDLNLPKKSGMEILKEIKSEENLKENSSSNYVFFTGRGRYC